MSNRPWTAEPTKATPTTSDELLILDVADSNINKRVTIGSLPILEFLGPWTGTHNAGNQLLNNVNAIAFGATPATVGQVRLGNTQSVQWRNAANDANILFGLDSSDNFFMQQANALDMSTAPIINSQFYETNAANPATAGAVRLGNNETLDWRNAANNANHSLGFLSDILRIDIAGTEEYRFSATLADFNGNGLTEVGQTNFTAATLTYNATQVFDFDANQYRQITLTGDLTTLSTSNRAVGKVMSIVVIGDSLARNITLNTNWETNPADPIITVNPNSVVVMSFYCSGTDEGDVIVAATEFS